MILYFINISNDYFVFVIDCGYDVRIDIELIKHIEYTDKIVELYFSNEEKRVYYNYGSTNKRRARYFLLIWTRIEVYTKCLGRSLFDYQRHNITDHNLKQYSSMIGDIVFSMCSANPVAVFVEKAIPNISTYQEKKVVRTKYKLNLPYLNVISQP